MICMMIHISMCGNNSGTVIIHSSLHTIIIINIANISNVDIMSIIPIMRIIHIISISVIILMF